MHLVASGWVGEVRVERADGSEQGLVDARAGTKAGVGCDFRPAAFCSEGGDLGVVWIGAGIGPCEGLRDVDERMEKDEDRLEAAVVGIDEGEIVGRIDVVLELHATG